MNICNMNQYATNVLNFYCEMPHRVLHYLTNVKYKDGRYSQFFRSVSNTQAITTIKELCVNKSLQGAVPSWEYLTSKSPY